MAVRIRQDGRILCAATHPAQEGDTYLDDVLHHLLSVEARVLVTEPMDGPAGRGGHAAHGEWWWITAVPSDVAVDPFYLDAEEASENQSGRASRNTALSLLLRRLPDSNRSKVPEDPPRLPCKTRVSWLSRCAWLLSNSLCNTSRGPA